MTKQEILDRLMPSIFNTTAEAYRLLISDAENDGGAIALALKDIDAFREYYTKAISVDDASDILIDKIAELFIGMERHYGEADTYMRLAYKSLVTRHGYGPRATREALRQAYNYFVPDSDIHIVEDYPTENLLNNPSFDTMSSDWTYSGLGIFLLTYSKSLDGVAIGIMPAGIENECSVAQTVNIANDGLQSLVFFFSSTSGIMPASLNLTVYHAGMGKYWDAVNGIWTDTETKNRYDVENTVPGKYTVVQVLIPCTSGSLQIKFSTLNEWGFLLDKVAIGKIGWPNVYAFPVKDPEVFHDGAIYYDNKDYHTGFFEDADLIKHVEVIMANTHAAGVQGVANLVVGQNYSFDMTWMDYSGKILHDGTYLHAVTG